MITNSITVRTSLLFTLLAAGVFAAMGLVVHSSVNQHFMALDRNNLDGNLELVRHTLAGIRSIADEQRAIHLLKNELIGNHYLVVRIDGVPGTTLVATGNSNIPDSILKLRYNEVARGSLLTWQQAESTYRGVVVDIPAMFLHQHYRVALGLNTSQHQVFLRKFARDLLSTGGGGLLLMAVLGWLATLRGLHPVKVMAKVAESITAQRLQDRLDLDKVPAELQPLARAFNDMLNRLGESLTRLSGFSSDIAHELRTPINNLMMQTQVSLAHPRSIHEYQDILYSSLEEYERLARMIADMLFLAKADHNLIVPQREQFDVRIEIEALIEFYTAPALDRHVTLLATGHGMIEGDRLMIRRALSNVFSNAIRHSSAECSINIDIKASTDKVSICIGNEGDTILPHQLSRIFDRFYRGDASRQHTDEGTGLGLAITRSIIQAHGGTISAQSAEGKTIFDLELPCVMPTV